MVDIKKNTVDLTQVEFHSFYWDNFSQDILSAHKKVMKHFGLNVAYTQENIPHGQWLDRIMQQSTKKVIAIIEHDLIPSFLKTKRADVAEELAYTAESLGIRYRTLYPNCFEKAPQEGVWCLGSYGYYGIGTVFAHSVYHLFQSRKAENIQLFVQRCDEVINNRFDTTSFICSTTLNPVNNLVEIAKPKKRRWYKRIFGK